MSFYGQNYTCDHGEPLNEQNLGIDCPACRPDSWRPMDLGPYLRGEIKKPEPCVGACRVDGVQFLYPGKEHSIIGEMEAGKSWFALACVATELNTGNRVVYVHFEEADPSDSIERLLTLGVPGPVIGERFRFIAPERAVTAERIAPLVAENPSLVVLDGVNEGMALHGHAVREEDGVAAFRRIVIKPFINAGCAVLSADHVVKDKESRGRYALGSIHKGNALSGALIMLENSEPFGRGARGVSNIYITKDRPGHLRRHGRPTKTSGKTFMGQMIVDDTRRWVSYLDLQLTAPAPEVKPEDTPASADDLVFAAVEKLNADIGSATVRAVEAVVPIRKSEIGQALERLKIEGRLVEAAGPRNSRLFTPSATVPRDQDDEAA